MILKPAIWWMNRLRYSEKFLWLGAILLIGFGILLSPLKQHFDEESTNLQAERDGLAYTRLVTLAVQQLQQHRGRSASVLGGNSAMREAREQKAQDVDAALIALQNALPSDLRQLPELQQINAQWRNLQTKGLDWPVQTNFRTHTALIDQLLNVLITVGDTYHLVLDSEISVYYLIDLSINKLPALTERMGKLRAYGSAIVSKREISDAQYYELQTLLAELRAIHEQAQRNLQHTGKVDAQDLQSIKAAGAILSQENANLAMLVENHILNRNFSIAPEDYFAGTTKAIDAVFSQLLTVMYPLIERRLADRQEAMRAEWIALLVKLLAVLVVLTYLVVGGYFAMSRGMQEVLGAIRAMAAGAISRRARLESKDEIAQIGNGFNEMADSIQKLILEREADHQELQSRADSLLLAGRVFEDAYEGISVTDTSGVILNVNPMYCKMTGFTREELIGATHRKLHSSINPPDVYVHLWRELDATGHWQGELWNRRKDGADFAVELTITALRNAQGEVINYVGLSSDITELKKQHEKMERLAHHDALTGLPNRTLLSDRLQQALVRSHRNGEVAAVVGVDLDGFKAVNDTHGHEAGDMLLKEIACRVESALRAGDTVARLGGDEFVLVLCNVHSEEDCAHTLERILTAINQPVNVGEGKVAHVSGSMGYTLFPDDSVDADTLMRHADLAMYAAKQSGKNRFMRFDHRLDQKQRANAHVLTRLEKGLVANEFALHIQPKVNQLTGKVVGGEALIRWNHPIRGLIPPSEFLPLIEREVPLAIKFDTWVLDESLRLLTEWRKVGQRWPLSINVSSHQLLRHDFSERLLESLARHPELTGSDLEIEILESVALDDVPQVAKLIQACQRNGIRFSLDDFGTGYSTLTYLKQLSVNTLKIDQSFVRDMEQNSSSRAIVQGIIGLASAFNYAVVAEGVETEAQAQSLAALGCAIIQGYLIARPMPAADIVQWVSQFQSTARVDSVAMGSGE